MLEAMAEHIAVLRQSGKPVPEPRSLRRPARVLPAASHSRLQKIKARYDPDQVIISGHPVRPASVAA
jgi:hypothetical protein